MRFNNFPGQKICSIILVLWVAMMPLSAKKKPGAPETPRHFELVYGKYRQANDCRPGEIEALYLTIDKRIISTHIGNCRAQHKISRPYRKNKSEIFLNLGQGRAISYTIGDFSLEPQNVANLDCKCDGKQRFVYLKTLENSLKKAVTERPTAADHMLYARLMAHNGQVKTAKKHFETALKSSPENALAHYYHARLLHYQYQNRKKAIEGYSKALEYRKDFAWAMLHRGIARYAQGEYLSAIVDFNQHYRLTKSGESLFHRARAEYKIGQKGVACSDFQKAFSLGYQAARLSFLRFCRR